MSEKEVIPLERQTGASCSLQNCPEKYGVLPACAGLAVPYVPFQQEDPPKYSQSDALRNGTLFPYLNLPFFRMVEGSTLPGGPMAQLQALEFVLVELGAYLDTHPADAEALAMFRECAALERSARMDYEERFGPLTQSAGSGERYAWLDDPWPWNYEQNEVK